jgi:hypothetical protein
MSSTLLLESTEAYTNAKANLESLPVHCDL